MNYYAKRFVGPQVPLRQGEIPKKSYYDYSGMEKKKVERFNETKLKYPHWWSSASNRTKTGAEYMFGHAPLKSEEPKVFDEIKRLAIMKAAAIEGREVYWKVDKQYWIANRAFNEWRRRRGVLRGASELERVSTAAVARRARKRADAKQKAYKLGITASGKAGMVPRSKNAVKKYERVKKRTGRKRPAKSRAKVVKASSYAETFLPAGTGMIMQVPKDTKHMHRVASDNRSHRAKPMNVTNVGGIRNGKPVDITRFNGKVALNNKTQEVVVSDGNGFSGNMTVYESVKDGTTWIEENGKRARVLTAGVQSLAPVLFPSQQANVLLTAADFVNSMVDNAVENARSLKENARVADELQRVFDQNKADFFD